MCRYIMSCLSGESGQVPRQGWKALLRILRVCLSRDPSLVRESVNLSGPLIQIVIDSNSGSGSGSGSTTDSNNNGSEEEDGVGDGNKGGNDDANADMVDATLDSLAVLQLLLSSPSVSSTAVSDILVNTQVLARLLGEVQLSHTSWKVRSATFAFTRSLAAAAGGSMCERMLFDVMFRHIMKQSPISVQNLGCDEYFIVLEDLIASSVSNEAVQNAAEHHFFSPSVMVDYLCSSLTKYQKILKGGHGGSGGGGGGGGGEESVGMEGESSYLIGTLHLLAALLRHRPSLLQEHAKLSEDGFVKEVYNDYLYSVPTLQNKDAWPFCRTTNERKAAFRVLFELTSSSSSSASSKDRTGRLVELVQAFRSTVSMDKVGWKVVPTTRRVSRFAGLNNQGCTCYQNATLQQLYLIKDIREGVLNAPLSPLLKDNQRLLIDCTPMINMNVSSTTVSPSDTGTTTDNAGATKQESKHSFDRMDPLQLINKKVEIQWESGKWYVFIFFLFCFLFGSLFDCISL